MSVFLDSKSLYVPDAAASETTYDPRLGAENLLRLGIATVTASAEMTGGEKENAYAEGLTFDFWKPGASGVNWLRASLSTAKKSNYVGVAAHNLHQVDGSIKMQHSTDGGSSWSDSTNEYLPANSQPIMILYDDVTAGDHRLWINSTGNPIIGVVHFGEVVKFESPITGPWTPPHLARLNRYVPEVAEGGQFLGRSLIAEGARLELNIRGVDFDWARDTWQNVVDLIQTHGFFFAARDLAKSGLSESEVFYGWPEEQPITRYMANVGAQIQLTARGVIS